MKEIKTVYVPVNNETKSTNVFGIVKPIDKSFVKFVFVEKLQLITFTPEEYNQHIQEVIDDALNTAAEEAEITNKVKFSGDYNPVVDEESIINTSKQTFEKWKI